MRFLHDGAGKALCCLAHGELAWLFHEPHTGLDHCPRILLSCFRSGTSGEAASCNLSAELVLKRTQEGGGGFSWCVSASPTWSSFSFLWGVTFRLLGSIKIASQMEKLGGGRGRRRRPVLWVGPVRVASIIPVSSNL